MHWQQVVLRYVRLRGPYLKATGHSSISPVKASPEAWKATRFGPETLALHGPTFYTAPKRGSLQNKNRTSMGKRLGHSFSVENAEKVHMAVALA